MRQNTLKVLLQEVEFLEQTLDEVPVFEAGLGKAWSETLEMLAFGR